jgi:hypothetical protein
MALSRAKFLWLPSGEWARVDEEIAASGTITATGSNWLVERELVVGMALRRGDVETADRLLVGWMEVAMASNEPQRIIPMASIALARATMAGDVATIRTLTENVLDTVVERHQWAPLANAAIPRAVFAAGDAELLGRLEDELASSTKDTRYARAMLVTSGGLRALLEGRVDDAVRLLDEVVVIERDRGARFTAACAELDLARAHELAGDDTAAAAARERADAVLVPLGCVHAIS